MKKIGRPWFRKSKNSWYVQRDGEQIHLATGRRNRAEAYARFAELLATVTAKPVVEPPSVGQVVERFEMAARQRVKSSTAIAYGCVLKPFVTRFGKVATVELKAGDVEAWAGRQRWSSSTRRYALTVVATMYRWAESEELIPANPMRKLRKPPGKSRGAEVLIGNELHERILSVVSPDGREFLRAVQATGARPGEVARVEAKDVVWDARCWVLTDHKTAGTGRVRTIYLPDAVVSVCRALAAKYPSGPLFRTTRGEPWRKTSWKQAMARAQRKLGLDRRPLVSGYRHTFATDALEAGVPDAHVAELLGHSSTAMVHRHYGHLTAKGRALRDSLKRVRCE